MKILSTLAIVLVLCWHAQALVLCPATHFDFTGKYSIGKQDELNRTFTKIQEKITSLENATFNTSETTSFTILNAKPTFYYRDSKQKGDIFGNNTIVIQGGQLEVDLTFDWIKKSLITTNGTGAAFGLSVPIIFAKKAVIIEEGGFFSYELLDYEDVVWSDGETFQLTRVDPATATEDDKKSLTRLLNNIMGVKTIRNLLEEEVDKFYSFYLRASLHDEHMPVDNHFDYKWVPGRGKPNVTIPFERRPLTIDIETAGIQLTFIVQIANYSDWKCGERNVPLLPLTPRVYGSTQQFISYDFYENVIKYAVAKNILDTDLTRESWQSRMFQFYAGDLYEVLDKLQTRYFASEPVTGNCKATFTGLGVRKSGFDTFNVSIHFDCELNIQRSKILDFAVGLELEIELVPNVNTMDFKLRSHAQHISFYPYADYKILQQELGALMISHSLNRLYEGFLFGSGYPLSPPRDYPHMMTEENCTVVYDSTHIDPHLVDL